MALKGPPLSWPLLLSVLFLAYLVDKSQANYQRFLRRHVDPRRPMVRLQAYCQQKMKAQGLTSPTCTKKNTFIHAFSSRVKSICGGGGAHFNGTLSDSLASYPITTCQYRRGSPPNHCRYRGQAQRRRIRVACSRGLPVGFRGILTSRH